MKMLDLSFGPFRVKEIVLGSFRLDGGAMFGSVPRALWGKLISPDDRNRIPMVARSLVVETADRVFLIDAGLGDKMSDKERSIYDIVNTPHWEKLAEPTDIILTHLHFDHCGGISRWLDAEKKTIALNWPNARIHIQEANVETASIPSIKERASYLRENVSALSLAETVRHSGFQEIVPGITVHRVNGHTEGMQWIEIRSGSDIVLFPSDLIPTAAHLHPAYTMGYDMNAKEVLREKQEFLSYAARHEAIVVFQHDATRAAAKIVEREGSFVGVYSY